MARRFEDIKGTTIEATDGKIGKVKDVLFDDQTWRVRYFVVDTGNWLPSRKVLLSPTSFSTFASRSEKKMAANLTKEQIEESPALETAVPVSRQYETRLHSHYGWAPYWGIAGGPIAAYPYPDAPFSDYGNSYRKAHADWATLEQQRTDRFDGHLRSLDEITGYKISTSDDEEFGEVSDAIIDDHEWFVIDLILNSHKWLPGGKEFVCSPMFIKDLNEGSKLLHLAQNKQTLLDGPDFDFDSYGESYRKSLVKHYCDSPKERHNEPTYHEQHA